jgi:flagellar biosynthesis/type III secretory pathway chaperone
MNDQLIDALTRNLEDELEVQDRLLEAMRRQRQRLLAGETDDLELLVDRIRELLDRSSANRSRRVSLLRSLGVDPAGSEPVNEIARIAAPERGRRLATLRTAILGAAREVRTLNQFNSQLVRRSAEIVESLLRVFTGLGGVPEYAMDGSRSRVRGGGVLVNQEA